MSNLEGRLLAASPNDRLRAATELKRSPFVVSIAAISRALQAESVPAIRKALNDVLAARQRESGAAKEAGESPVGPDSARLIRHELSPAIGWVRRAANREIVAFDASATSDAINRLERRVDSLVSLVMSGSSLRLQEMDLGSLLRESWPDSSAPPVFAPAQDLFGGELILRTDGDLLRMIISNAFQNAIDAHKDLNSEHAIEVAWGGVGGRFWVRVTNAFLGEYFVLKDIEAPGVSSKRGHQGVGMAIIQSAAERLEYSFKVVGSGGLALFTLTGGNRIGEAESGSS